MKYLIISHNILNSRRIILLLIIISLIFLSSCASSNRTGYTSGVKYVTASWYGAKFNGRPTASGERFDMYAMTCAHKKLPFGTKLRVTNPDNNRSVVVIVNDRGPFIPGRDLDLSYGAAKRIGHDKKGVGMVRMEHLGRDMRYVKRVPFSSTSSPGLLTVQMGSFTKKSNAYRLKKGLELKYSNVFVSSVYLKGQKYYRVRIGKFKDRDRAYSLADKLAHEGYTILITSL